MGEYEVFIEEDEEGGYVIECPSLPGCHTQGETIDEAVHNLKELIPLCLEAQRGKVPGKTPSGRRIKARKILLSGKMVIAA
jgi:predicted RNase H-like HicB family nuclease